jgi:pimeloyl-ACP methyl ester carboxylesterase
MRIRTRRRLAALVVALLGLGALTVSQQPVAAAPATKVNWSPCWKSVGPSFECGTVAVPLDYDQPTGATVSISLVRLPAADPSRRIGSLFLNPGGPGGSGVEFAVFAGPSLLTQEVRDRFDIVGFDPRGIARSTALRCFGSFRQLRFTDVAFPTTDDEAAGWIETDRYLDDACAQRGGALIDHMSTANVARDMDRLRIAVGDDKLTYYGVSYGTMLGQTYANMFPDRFRALAIDGVLDPVAWTTGAPGQQGLPFSTRLRSDQGARDTLREFFRLCDASAPVCPLSSGAGAEATYAAVAAALKAHPLPVTDPETGEVFQYTYSFLIGDTLGAMYNSEAWPDLASWVAALAGETSSAALGRRLSTLRGTRAVARTSRELARSTGYIAKRGFPRYYNFMEGFPAVACADSDNPDRYQAWKDAAAASETAFGYFGRLWTWVSSICAEWPGADPDRYTGPWNTVTDAPVLVVGARWDPATRYEGAVLVHDLLPHSALLTVNSWGHTSLFTSGCADRAIATYLITQATPAPGTQCDQDLVPWVDFGTS